MLVGQFRLNVYRHFVPGGKDVIGWTTNVTQSDLWRPIDSGDAASIDDAKKAALAAIYAFEARPKTTPNVPAAKETN
jgi:hypothetical protein